MDGTNIGPYLPPIPIPGVSKSLLPGAHKLEERNIFDDFMILIKNKKNH